MALLEWIIYGAAIVIVGFLIFRFSLKILKWAIIFAIGYITLKFFGII